MNGKSKYKNNILIYNDYIGDVNVKSLCITFYKQLMAFIETHPTTKKVKFHVRFSNEFCEGVQVINVKNLFSIKEETKSVVTTTRTQNRRWSDDDHNNDNENLK